MSFTILSWALGRRLIFRFKDDRRNRFAGFRVEPPCQNGDVVLKMTALDERIRRPESSLHAWELRSCRSPDASVPAISSSRRSSFQAGTSDTMRLTTTSEGINFLAEIGLVVCTLRSWCGSTGVGDRFWGDRFWGDRFWGDRSFFGQWFWLY